METVELDPQVLADRRGVVSGLTRPHGTAECVITLATLHAHFWLEPRASDARILKTFRDGYGRIRTIALRTLLAHPAARPGSAEANLRVGLYQCHHVNVFELR